AMTRHRSQGDIHLSTLHPGAMDKRWNKVGLAAVVLLAPGGFILGATLLANHYRKKAAAKDDDATGTPASLDKIDT
ncbi:hypothetical protein ACTGZM_11245, partial [Streptococcus suis]